MARSYANGNISQDHTPSCREKRKENSRRRCQCAWRFSLSVNGKPVRRGGFASREEARLAADAELRQHRGGIDIATRITLREWLAMDHKARADNDVVRASTLRTAAFVAEMVDEDLGDVPLRKLTTPQISQAFADIRRRRFPARSARTGEAMMGQAKRTLSAALNRAVKQGLLERNPAAHAVVPREAAEPPTVWTIPQAVQFLSSDEVQEHYLGAAFQLIAYLGLRRGEAVALKWEDWDPEAETLRIRRSAVVLGYATRIETPKTAAGNRVIDLDPLATAVLQRQRIRQAQERLAAGSAWADGDWITADPLGGMVHPALFTRHFATISSRLGLPHVRLHSLRHFHASVLLAANVAPVIVSRRLGHRDIQVTLNTYSHLLPSVGRAAADAAGALIAEEQARRAGG